MKSIKHKKQPIREESNETKPNDTKLTNCECINSPNKRIHANWNGTKSNPQTNIANQTNMMCGQQTKEKDNTHVKQNSYQSLKNTNFTFIQW
jgi:hypothetical protein